MRIEGLIHDHSEIEKKEEEILTHREAPINIPQLQMALAEELYRRGHPNSKIDLTDKKVRDMLLNYWIDTKYSSLFRLLVNKKEMKNEDPMAISLDELDKFIADNIATNN